jgi:hypothetical protein
MIPSAMTSAGLIGWCAFSSLLSFAWEKPATRHTSAPLRLASQRQAARLRATSLSRTFGLSGVLTSGSFDH